MLSGYFDQVFRLPGYHFNRIVPCRSPDSDTCDPVKVQAGFASNDMNSKRNKIKETRNKKEMKMKTRTLLLGLLLPLMPVSAQQPDAAQIMNKSAS